MGKSIGWDGKTNTVYIGKVNEDDTDAYLTNMDYFTIQSTGISFRLNNWDKEKDKDATGKMHDKALKFGVNSGPGEGYVEYLLNQEYQTFEGGFSLEHSSRNINLGTVLKIYGDDELLYTSNVIDGGSLPVDFSVDVSGVIKLKIKLETSVWRSGLKYYDTQYVLFNPSLYK
ncbi:MAG: NPCBM/NEW2 domain-containing protein [Clostridiaceae bacterium]|nr:NPCBM/NEW2 domain-containing protein [Clostridiaceae bacterium]